MWFGPWFQEKLLNHPFWWTLPLLHYWAKTKREGWRGSERKRERKRRGPHGTRGELPVMVDPHNPDIQNHLINTLCEMRLQGGVWR